VATSALASDARVRTHALSILDASMLLLAAALALAGSAVTGRPAESVPSLLLFSLLCFGLCTTTRSAFPRAAGQLGPAELVSVPILTTAAAAAVALGQAPLVGAGEAAFDVGRPWLLATAYLLAGRLSFAWATADRDATSVAKAIDHAAKRSFDAALAGALLVLALPILLAVAVAIKLEDRGPVFFRCARVGEGGRELLMLKFRKMRHDADGPPLTASDDDRFTRVGRFLAASKLDELPQLWNVLRGGMSLVGPRPEDPSFVAMYPDEFEEILAARPGMTGLCQLAFAKEGRILDPRDRVRDYSERLLPQKVALDLVYARRRTFPSDAKILTWTLVAVLLRKDVAVHRQTGTLTLRKRSVRREAATRAA
jgi:lipopolysaccharide/colanic/teichoic acid biosynthesis glycosyltransferase